MIVEVGGREIDCNGLRITKRSMQSVALRQIKPKSWFLKLRYRDKLVGFPGVDLFIPAPDRVEFKTRERVRVGEEIDIKIGDKLVFSGVVESVERNINESKVRARDHLYQLLETSGAAGSQTENLSSKETIQQLLEDTNFTAQVLDDGCEIAGDYFLGSYGSGDYGLDCSSRGGSYRKDVYRKIIEVCGINGWGIKRIGPFELLIGDIENIIEKSAVLFTEDNTENVTVRESWPPLHNVNNKAGIEYQTDCAGVRYYLLTIKPLSLKEIVDLSFTTKIPILDINTKIEVTHPLFSGELIVKGLEITEDNVKVEASNFISSICGALISVANKGRPRSIVIRFLNSEGIAFLGYENYTNDYGQPWIFCDSGNTVYFRDCISDYGATLLKLSFQIGAMNYYIEKKLE